MNKPAEVTTKKCIFSSSQYRRYLEGTKSWLSHLAALRIFCQRLKVEFTSKKELIDG